jgi:polysaccharide pyruvyl transferase WcaK-like protein
MPQTYGPFRDEAARREAAGLVAASAAAWARDAASHEELERLLGGAFNPLSHRCGVDVAFGLRAEAPSRPLPPELASWLDDAGDGPLVGLNVSGLTWNRADAFRRDYGLTADYRTAVRKLLGRLISRSNARVVIVPHVLTPSGHFESDLSAAEGAVAGFGPAARRRILIAPALSATEEKWLIARTTWFCATRLHSAVAALSSGVPAAAFAYGRKTRGVFETCGLGDHVADLRTYSAVGAADAVWRSFESRDDARARLAAALPRVLATAEEQMDAIVLVCRSLAASRTFDSEYATV